MPASAFLSILLATLGQGPSTGLVATINDPLSHGLPGDQRLSLDEAIRVANGTLALASLSAAERAQITGTGSHLGILSIDAAITPHITLEAPLTPITGGHHNHHEHIEVIGLPSRHAPRLLGGNHAHIFALRRHLVHLKQLHLVGGQVGIDAQMGPMGAHFHMAMAHDVHLELQTSAGVRVHASGNDESMLMLEHVHFDNMPVGIRIDDQSGAGMVMVECEHVHMDDVALGNDVIANGNGAMSMLNWFRSGFHHGDSLARQRRNATSTGLFMFRFVHVEAHCHGDVLDVQGNTTGLSMVHHHHSDFVAGNGHKAFWVHPRTAQFDIHGSEMEFTGDVVVAGNTFSPRFWQQNNTFRNGTVTFDVDGALPNLLWNRFEQCTLQVPATARSPVILRQSELFQTNVVGNSLFAPLQLRGCYRQNGSISGQASEQGPAPAAFLGTADIGPQFAPIGSIVRLSIDLPFGIGAFWDFAFSYPRPTTTAEPVRFYGDPQTAIVLPGMVVFQSTTQVPLPLMPALVGLEFYVQPVTIPLLGQNWAPAWHLPRGSLLRITN
jgi:hypothetical protein